MLGIGGKGGKGKFYGFFGFFDFLRGFGGPEGFQGVPGGRGYILTKFGLKRRHLDLVHARFHDFGLFFGCNVAYSGAMLPILGNVTYSGQCYIFWAMLPILGFVTYSGQCYIF